MPTKMEVPIFNPIWNEKALPIRFITKINIPPKIEFAINLKIALSGIENIFPTIHKPTIHPKIMKTVEMFKFYHHTLLPIVMIKLGQI